ncbi:hypothetical protein ACGE0T_19875 [Parabacteroides sp. APC149_11_2_Y6]
MKPLILLLALSLLSVTSCKWKKEEKGTSEEIHYNAFSHNDYWRAHPLQDALSLQFNCVEADLWPIDGELYVSHDRPETNPSITFEALYLKPLVARIQANGGKVYPQSDHPFFLMVDFKEKGEEAYVLLKKQMEPYKDLFCSVEDRVYKEGTILLFISGDRPKKTLPMETTRSAFLDGQIADLNQGIPASLAPVVSDNYKAYFSWMGEGEMPADQLRKMREIISQTHKEGKLFRWWGAPDTPQFQRFFMEEGVDLIGADDLEALHKLLVEE